MSLSRLAPLDQQVAFHWFAERSVPRLLVRCAVGGWVSQWRNDVDGPVMRLRDWYRQYFPPSREASRDYPRRQSP